MYHYQNFSPIRATLTIDFVKIVIMQIEDDDDDDDDDDGSGKGGDTHAWTVKSSHECIIN